MFFGGTPKENENRRERRSPEGGMRMTVNADFFSILLVYSLRGYVAGVSG